MRLTEHEGKQLINQAGLLLPHSQIVTVAGLVQLGVTNIRLPIVAKAQVPHGNRAVHGLVKKIDQADQIIPVVSQLLRTKDNNQQPISTILLEQHVSYTTSRYLAITYDTHFRQAVINYSDQAGEGMDERGDTIITTPCSVIQPPTAFPPEPELLPTIKQLWQVFVDHDCSLVEINPLALHEGKWYCLDAKIELEDSAAYRHPEWQQYGVRSQLGRPPTPSEEAAHAVSRSDHRGAAGESFFEFPSGTIGVLAAGGGASVLAMDSLLAQGLSPANYTEHSGNPPRTKVKALTDVILSLPNLEGLFVVGTNANFTDIFETMAGMVDSVLEHTAHLRSPFPILVRRGGPRWQEAFAMIHERLQPPQFLVTTLGPDFPIVETASAMKKLLEKAHVTT